MSFKPFKQIRVPPDQQPTDKNINDLQSNIAGAFSQILGKDNLDRVLLKDISLVPGLNKVPHTLGRPISGWEVCRPRRGYAWLWEDDINNQSPNLLNYIYSAASCLIDLEVF